jgi:hypothetical protein
LNLGPTLYNNNSNVTEVVKIIKPVEERPNSASSLTEGSQCSTIDFIGEDVSFRVMAQVLAEQIISKAVIQTNTEDGLYDNDSELIIEQAESAALYRLGTMHAADSLASGFHSRYQSLGSSNVDLNDALNTEPHIREKSLLSHVSFY